jgi:hypothetical protein
VKAVAIPLQFMEPFASLWHFVHQRWETGLDEGGWGRSEQVGLSAGTPRIRYHPTSDFFVRRWPGTLLDATTRRLGHAASQSEAARVVPEAPIGRGA